MYSRLVETLQAWAGENSLVAVLSAVSILTIIYYALSRPDPRSPPYVSYWIPWVGSAIALGKDPDGFFRNASAKLGPIFSVKAAGRNMTYVTSPALIAAIYRDSKTFEFQSIRQSLSTDIFSIPENIIRSPEVPEVYYPAHHRVLAPKSLGGVIERYAQHTFRQISARISELDGTSTPLVKLIIMPAYISASNAFFGEIFPAAKTYGDFEIFNNAFHIMVAQLPRFITAGPRKAWETVVDAFEKYIHDVRKSGEMHELVDATLSVGDHAGWNDHVLAAMLAADMWAMQANAVWAAYWFLVLLLQHPDDLKRVNIEVDAAHAKWKSTHSTTPLSASNFAQFMSEHSDQFPLITSGILETLRLRTSSFSIRRVTTPTDFGGYKFNVNDELICNTRVIHMDEEIHERPYDFVLDRYTDSGKKYTKNGSPVPNHSLPFGGGVSVCEGRHFAQAEIKTFIVTLLSLVNIEVDLKRESWPSLAMDRIGVGIISPKGDVNVIVRQRAL